MPITSAIEEEREEDFWNSLPIKPIQKVISRLRERAYLKRLAGGAGFIGLLLRGLALPTEGSGSLPGIDMEIYSYSSSGGYNKLFWSLSASGTYLIRRHTHGQIVTHIK